MKCLREKQEERISLLLPGKASITSLSLYPNQPGVCCKKHILHPKAASHPGIRQGKPGTRAPILKAGVQVEVNSFTAALDRLIAKQMEDRSHMRQGKSLHRGKTLSFVDLMVNSLHLALTQLPALIKRVTGEATAHHPSLPLNTRFCNDQIPVLETGKDSRI